MGGEDDQAPYLRVFRLENKRQAGEGNKDKYKKRGEGGMHSSATKNRIKGSLPQLTLQCGKGSLPHGLPGWSHYHTLCPLQFPSQAFVLFTILHFRLEGPFNSLPTVTSQNTWNDCLGF